MSARTRRPERGFTLVELIVVVVIMGLLVAVGAFAYQSVVSSTRKRAAVMTAQQLARDIYGLAASRKTAGAPVATEQGDWVADVPTGVAFTVHAPDPVDGTVQVSVARFGWCVPVTFSADPGTPARVETDHVVKSNVADCPTTATSPAPATAPQAPAAPVATAGVRGSGSVTVSWAAPADGGAAIDNYQVTVSPATGVTGPTTRATTGTTLVFDGLTQNVSYTFTVAAHNSIGWSADSGPSTPVSVGSAYPILVSATPGGNVGDGQSAAPSISSDGRYVGFASAATDLVAGDTNGVDDVFIRDVQTGTTTLVSVATDGTQGNGASGGPTISGGRYVVFHSTATNLVAGDTNAAKDVFVRDLQTGTTTRVSVATDGTQGNGASQEAAISSDGRYVAFRSAATNLVAGDTNGTQDIFVRDLQTSTTTRVSVATGGTQGNGLSQAARLSADGRYVGFVSAATNLVTGDTNGVNDAFVRDLQTGTTTLVSVATDGTQGNGASWSSLISGDGRYVVFESTATNLVTGDTNAAKDVFIRDLQTGTTTRVSVATDGTQGNGDTSATGAISGDGRYVAFQAANTTTNLVPGDTNGNSDTLVRDVVAGTTTRVSVPSDGTQSAGGDLWYPAVSADGRFVVFTSTASNLVPGDTNGNYDVFVVPAHP